MPTLTLQTLISWMFGIPPRQRQPKCQTGKQTVASTKRRSSAGTPQKPAHSASNAKPGIRFRSFEAFHGTPSLVNARSIIRDGWMIGRGNAHGDGVYMGLDRTTALPYATPTGVLVRCRVSGISCEWGPHIEAHYTQWCQNKRVAPDNSARTAYLLSRGVQLLRTGKVLVVLQPQYANPTAFKTKLRCIRILGVHSASNNRVVRV